MKQSDGYNTPKGVANNAAQQQVRAKRAPITKKTVPLVAVPVLPSTRKIANGDTP